ncbi:MAG: hypothetical protein AAGA25_02115 [Planctomycetota bacterium]
MPKTKNKKRKAKQEKPLKLSTARPVAAEDLRVGDGVAVAYVTQQILADDDPPPDQTYNRIIKADLIPYDSGEPLRIVGVCLPFILAKNTCKRHVTLDVRRQHLVKLDLAYTRRAFKKLGGKKR